MNGRRVLQALRWRWRLALCLLCGVLAVPASAEKLLVVVHPDSPVSQVDLEDLAALYLGQRNGLNNMRGLAPLDLRSVNLRERFYRQVTQRNLAQLRAYWARRVFTGKGRPPKAFGTEAVISRLKSEPNAIGYLPESAAAGLKTVGVVPE